MLDHDVRARVAIGDSLARYCRAVDRMDMDLALSLWAPDAELQYGPGIFEGTPRKFFDWTFDIHRGLAFTVHRLGNVVTEVRGTTAASETSGRIVLVGLPREDGLSEVVTAYGRYLDTWAFLDGQWLITSRDYRRDARYSQSLEVSTFLGPRDGTDFSYGILGS